MSGRPKFGHGEFTGRLLDQLLFFCQFQIYIVLLPVSNP